MQLIIMQALGMGSCWMDTKIRPETGSWKDYSWVQLSCVAEDKSVSRLLSPPSRGIGWARRAHGYRMGRRGHSKMLFSAGRVRWGPGGV
jgi:hypothetical protein